MYFFISLTWPEFKNMEALDMSWVDAIILYNCETKLAITQHLQGIASRNPTDMQICRWSISLYRIAQHLHVTYAIFPHTHLISKQYIMFNTPQILCFIA